MRKRIILIFEVLSKKLLNLSPSLMITGIPGFAGVVETLHSARVVVETVSTLNTELMEMEIKT